MNRRNFLKSAARACAAAAVATNSPRGMKHANGTIEDVSAAHIPRWRGFNIQAKFGWPGSPYDGPAFEEFDFATMAEWGFDFARLPLSYWNWGSRDDWTLIREEPLKKIDAGIELGRQYNIHINLNFHRVPGYCINERELEPADLFTGTAPQREKALKAAAFHWKTFAQRYKGIPSRQLSFDLINEPPKMRSYEGALEERYVEIVKALVTAIREVDPSRLIFADGMNIGQAPVEGIIGLGLVQSTRGYLPKAVSHYTATWVPRDEFETFNPPTWPLKDDQGKIWDRERLKQECIERYRVLTDKKVQVHVGEWGCFNKTPHQVALAWMTDCASLWREAGWGNALWNLRGSFGVLDSERTDVKYEGYRGHKLDRKMLEILRNA
ncbi:MAG TPA: cellulase family glycosylhydrolase [Candidatus Limnocylindrales bacterium]|nr:cellulase family glycosylhydrolase [Candidatus Limnocylindrales bacterium]